MIFSFKKSISLFSVLTLLTCTNVFALPTQENDGTFTTGQHSPVASSKTLTPEQISPLSKQKAEFFERYLGIFGINDLYVGKRGEGIAKLTCTAFAIITLNLLFAKYPSGLIKKPLTLFGDPLFALSVALVVPTYLSSGISSGQNLRKIINNKAKDAQGRLIIR